MSNTITHNLAWDNRTLDLKAPHQKYFLKDGTHVPGCTTVLSCLSKPALIHWSADEERKGIIDCYNRNADIPEKFFYLTKRDTAATVGSCAHWMCEGFLKKFNPSFASDIEENLVNKAYESFRKFKSWWEESEFEVVESEVQMVSETLKAGGTADIISRDQQGRLVLVDLKTNKKIYKKDMGLQMSCYKMLYEETTGKKIDRCILVRIGKELASDMEVWECEDIKPFEKSFVQLTQLYHSLNLLPK
jgi:hypothetical protein